MKADPYIPSILRNDDEDRIPIVLAQPCEKCGGKTVIIFVNSRTISDLMNPDMFDGVRIRFVTRCTECLHDARYRLGVYASVWPFDCQKDNPCLAELVRKRELNDLRRLKEKYEDKLEIVPPA